MDGAAVGSGHSRGVRRGGPPAGGARVRRHRVAPDPHAAQSSPTDPARPQIYRLFYYVVVLLAVWGFIG